MARKRTLPLIEDFDSIPEEALVPEEEQPYPIPEHWKWVRWGSVGEFTSGTGFPKHRQGNPEGDYPFFKVGSLKDAEPNGFLSFCANYIDECIRSELRAKVIPAGSLVFAKIGEAIRLNRRALLVQSSCIDNNLFAFTPARTLSNRFLYLWASSIDLYPYAVATGAPSIRKSVLEQIPFPLPPLEEQGRIVEYIEQTNAKIDDVIQRLNQYIEEAPNRRAELIQAGVSGVLTKNWRDGRGNSADKSESMAPEDARKWGSSQILSRKHPKCDEGIAPSISSSELLEKSAVKKSKKLPLIADFDNIPEEALVPEAEQPYKIPEHWKWARLGALLKYVQRGKGPKYANLETGYLAVSQKCVRWEGLDLTQARPWVASSFQDLNDVRLLREQDLLWNSTGTGTIGRIAVVPPLRENLRDRLAADSHVTVMRTTGLLDSKYLFYFISSIHIQGQVEDGLASGSTNQKELGLAVIKSLPTPLPLLDEQKEIACLLDAALSRVELNMELVQEVLDKVRGLRQQLISAALAGKLA
ncbi:hypothetical protein GSS88_02115 [Corynebacterium sp. 3HC-13]|uniref:restriction endonuclease subunit S n=1 Tax=Corynebacterium poyangense TaxID=2684405 RepID=UPI001CCF4F74|nr:restriction endonuclease subunit S [Corynebacterium poyangense]MBZ8176594.1 hypothetical protein [Corynebacterium poyangense]